MAHLFKKPTNGNKGIIVFTHKELKYFFRPVKPLSRKRPSTFVPFVIDWLYTRNRKIPFFTKELEKLRQKYFIGMHLGAFHDTFPEVAKVDFLMSAPGTKGFEVPKNVLHIPFNSRNFTPKFFQDNNYNHKFWDIISVARATHVKKLDLILKAVKKLNDLEQKPHKLLLIIPPNSNENPREFYVNIMDDYYNWFTEEERNHITIMKLSKDLSAFGIPQESITHFYNSTKIFTLFSQKEGESRVIAEALLCGCPVVVKADLIGGGRDFLNPENSVYFDEYEHAHLAFKKALDNYETLQKGTGTEDLKQNLREDYTIPILKDYFKKLYQQNNQYFDGQLLNTNNLDRRLPAHTQSVPWNRGRYGSADIMSFQQFEIFKQYIS